MTSHYTTITLYNIASHYTIITPYDITWHYTIIVLTIITLHHYHVALLSHYTITTSCHSAWQNATSRHITSHYTIITVCHSAWQNASSRIIASHYTTMRHAILHHTVLNSIMLHTGSYHIYFGLANDDVLPHPSEIKLLLLVTVQEHVQKMTVFYYNNRK